VQIQSKVRKPLEKVNHFAALLTANFQNVRRTTSNRRDAKRRASCRTWFGVYVTEGKGAESPKSNSGAGVVPADEKHSAARCLSSSPPGGHRPDLGYKQESETLRDRDRVTPNSVSHHQSPKRGQDCRQQEGGE
jgi:hypothetical protein